MSASDLWRACASVWPFLPTGALFLRDKRSKRGHSLVKNVPFVFYFGPSRKPCWSNSYWNDRRLFTYPLNIRAFLRWSFCHTLVGRYRLEQHAHDWNCSQRSHNLAERYKYGAVYSTHGHPYNYGYGDCSTEVFEEKISIMLDIDEFLMKNSSGPSLPSMEELNSCVNHWETYLFASLSIKKNLYQNSFTKHR